MKIVTWNCNGAFRKKFHALEGLAADICVIQECEDPAHAKGPYQHWAGTYLWHGENKHKGLGVFARNGITIRRLDWDDDGLQSFLPVRVNDAFNLIAVWTKEANSPTFRYIGQLWKYLQKHKDRMAAEPTVLCGDLNSNKIWDVWDRWWNHSDVVRELAEAKMRSLYHLATGEEQGAESAPTFFLHRNLAKPYHIDFAFASDDLFDRQRNSVVVGHHSRWLELSDHVPVEFSISTST